MINNDNHLLLLYAYIITPQGVSSMAQLSRQFLIRKLKEFEAL